MQAAEQIASSSGEVQAIDTRANASQAQVDLPPVREEFVQFQGELKKLLELVTPLINEHYAECGRPHHTKINNFAMPREIIAALGEIPSKGQSIEECVETIKTTFKYSVKTMHPLFNDKLYCGSDPIGQIAELVVAVLNTGVHVYHVSPVFSVMEVECIKFFGAKFGFNPATVDGCLNPGGSMSNMMSVLCARQRTFPHVRLEGWNPEDKPIGFTPIQSHYSIARGAMVCGMGMNQMRGVPCDRMTGRMSLEALEEMIQAEIAKGNKPFFVNSMAGSTVMGSYDDHRGISAICKKYNLWHHIDGCWGGFLAFADKHREKGLFDGAELADSISLNAHKGWGVPQQCSMIIINDHKDLLLQTCASGADYLFHETEYSQYDIADKTLSCGRRPDGLKLWLSLQRHGAEGYVRMAEEAWDKAIYLTNAVRKWPEAFEMINDPQGCNVCFSYTPPAFRGKPYSDDQKSNVHKRLFERFHDKGTLLIQHNPLPDHNLPNFLRYTLKGEKSRLEDMDYVLAEIDRLGQDFDESNV